MNMEEWKKYFEDEEYFSYLNDFILEKSISLKNIEKYVKQEARLMRLEEELEEELETKELKEKFNDYVVAMSRLDEYYYVFAYLLGAKFGRIK